MMALVKGTDKIWSKKFEIIWNSYCCVRNMMQYRCSKLPFMGFSASFLASSATLALLIWVMPIIRIKDIWCKVYLDSSHKIKFYRYPHRRIDFI